MELLQTLRKIRACEGDAAAQLLLEAYVMQEVAAVREVASATGLGANDVKMLTDELWVAYQQGYDDFAGPAQFRHTCNFDDYHRAGLMAVYKLLVSNAELRDAQRPA